MDIDRAKFTELLTERFPEVARSISDCASGLLHTEMGHFAMQTNDAIQRGEAATVRAHFEFIEEIFGSVTEQLENAIVVSYLEVLRFEPANGAALNARTWLSRRLNRILVDLESSWGGSQ